MKLLPIFLFISSQTLGQANCDSSLEKFLYNNIYLNTIVDTLRDKITKYDYNLEKFKIIITDKDDEVSRLNNDCLIITKNGIENKLKKLAYIHTDSAISAASENAILVATLGTFYHEMGHYFSKVYKKDDILHLENKSKQSQAREYYADFISGFIGGKCIWMIRRTQMEASCSIDKIALFKIIINVVNGQTQSMKEAFECIYQFMEPYKHSSILQGLDTSSIHGLPLSRKQAFDAGIYYAIIDGIAKDPISDKDVKSLIDSYLMLHSLTLKELKEKFAINLLSFLNEYEGMENLSVTIKEYPFEDFLNEGIKFVYQLHYTE